MPLDPSVPAELTGTIVIKIIETEQRESPFPGIKVSIRDVERKSPPRKKFTDLRGEATFEELPVGIYSVRISAPGYYSIRDEVQITEDTRQQRREYVMRFQNIIPLRQEY